NSIRQSSSILIPAQLVLLPLSISRKPGLIPLISSFHSIFLLSFFFKMFNLCIILHSISPSLFSFSPKKRASISQLRHKNLTSLTAYYSHGKTWWVLDFPTFVFSTKNIGAFPCMFGAGKGFSRPRVRDFPIRNRVEKWLVTWYRFQFGSCITVRRCSR
ncbi:hypothetical protein LINGRAHAP2_LOCUS23424, partial [Linum grandiflorum]